MFQDPRPTVASVLTIVGGVFVLVGGLVLWIVGTVLAHVFGLSSPLFFGGVLLGLVTIVLGGLLAAVPRARRALGAAVLVCAVASLPLAFGGFVVGFGLTAVGGAIALARSRPRVIVTTASTPSGRPPPWT